MSDQIKATIIADSINKHNGKRITTFELEFHRYILPEFNTHRMFSRNSASSRAVPVMKSIELVEKNMAEPVHWGKNQTGMQAYEELSEAGQLSARVLWQEAADCMIGYAQQMAELGVHKQIVNRLLEPFKMTKVVCTATEYENFFWLRDEKSAQPEIQELAKKMRAAMDASEPVRLVKGEWHTPYYGHGYWSEEACTDSLKDALAISASCCAQVSYRKLDDSLEKAKAICERLMTDDRIHASPFEHQATPFHGSNFKGSTHTLFDGLHCSGNLNGWIQYRHLIPNNTKKG